MIKRLITLLVFAVAAIASLFAQLEIKTDARTVTSQVYLQFEGSEIIPASVAGVTSVDPLDSVYLKNPKGTVAQEANKLMVDADENVLWMDYDGHLKFDSTLLNADNFSFACDLKWSGANNVWYLGIFGFVGFDNNRIVADVPTPGYANRHVQIQNPTNANLQGVGISTPLFPERDEWAHLVLTYDTGLVKIYINDSLAKEGNTETMHNWEGLELYLGLKATVNPETGEVTPGRATNAVGECKETKMFLDDVALFDVTLTAEEASLVYAAAQGEVSALRSVKTETLSAFPNPVVNTLYLQNSKVSSVAIYNQTGMLVQQSVVANSSVDMSQLRSGIYFVRAFDNNQQAIASLKVMKR